MTGTNSCSSSVLHAHAAERSSSEGFLLEDVFAFPDYPGSIPKGTKPPDVKVVFGCEQQETGEIYRQTADGILGMGNNNNAFQSQVRVCAVLGKSFCGKCAHCCHAASCDSRDVCCTLRRARAHHAAMHTASVLQPVLLST